MAEMIYDRWKALIDEASEKMCFKKRISNWLQRLCEAEAREKPSKLNMYRTLSIGALGFAVGLNIGVQLISNVFAQENMIMASGNASITALLLSRSAGYSIAVEKYVDPETQKKINAEVLKDIVRLPIPDTKRSGLATALLGPSEKYRRAVAAEFSAMSQDVDSLDAYRVKVDEMGAARASTPGPTIGRRHGLTSSDGHPG